MAPRPGRKITSLYTTGLKANKLKTIKRALQANCNVAFRQVPNIGFIGRSIAEFHVFVDYALEFKEKVSKNLPGVSFIDLDPLDPRLFKDETATDTIRMAAQKLTLRLAKRLEETPAAAHKKYLELQLKRAAKQEETGRFEPLVSTSNRFNELTEEDLMQ